MGDYKETAISRQVYKSVGGQTFCEWRGKKVVKMKITSNSSKTPAQIAQRRAFAELADLSYLFGEAAELGFPKRPRVQTPQNAFMQANAGVVTVDETGEMTVDYPRITCSKGSLTVPAVTVTSDDETHSLTFEHPAQSNGWHRNVTDRLVAVVLEKVQKEVQVFELNNRSDAEPVTVQFDAAWSKENLCVYVFVLAENGKQASPTQYLNIA